MKLQKENVFTIKKSLLTLTNNKGIKNKFMIFLNVYVMMEELLKVKIKNAMFNLINNIIDY
jgi:hypothetical protein